MSDCEYDWILYCCTTQDELCGNAIIALVSGMDPESVTPIPILSQSVPGQCHGVTVQTWHWQPGGSTRINLKLNDSDIGDSQCVLLVERRGHMKSTKLKNESCTVTLPLPPVRVSSSRCSLARVIAVIPSSLRG